MNHNPSVPDDTIDERDPEQTLIGTGFLTPLDADPIDVPRARGTVPPDLDAARSASLASPRPAVLRTELAWRHVSAPHHAAPIHHAAPASYAAPVHPAAPIHQVTPLHQTAPIHQTAQLHPVAAPARSIWKIPPPQRSLWRGRGGTAVTLSPWKRFTRWLRGA